MALSNENRQFNRSQVDNSKSDSSFSSRSSPSQIDNFLSLLADLQIIDQPSRSPSPEIDSSQDYQDGLTIDIAVNAINEEELKTESLVPELISFEEPEEIKAVNPESLLSVLAEIAAKPSPLQKTQARFAFHDPEDIHQCLRSVLKFTGAIAPLPKLLQNLDKDSRAFLHYSNASDSSNPLEKLQSLIVEPELVFVKQALDLVQQKLVVLETQVSDPSMAQKLAELENQMQDASAITNLESQLASLAVSQTNLPTEIAELRQKLNNLERQVREPEELLKLLLPLIARVISMKIVQSREEICEAIVPIIDEVIQERSHQDKIAMSRALSDIIPMAISQQITDSPQEIARAIGPEIASAIREQIRLDGDAIANALAPEMGAAIRQQITLERDSMVDALYPVIGSTISKYMAEAIRSINEKIENTLSMEGFQRKIRAKMQGVSEAELIFRESIPFTVQALFLIHKNSGLVIADLQPPDQQSLESDMVAGMLTAIRSFANDCIARSGTVSELDQIDYGTSKIILEVAGYCYLAAAVQGTPPKSFMPYLRKTLANLVQTYGKEIEAFDGDPDSVPAAIPADLVTIMNRIKDDQEKAKKPQALLWFSLVVLSLLIIPWGIWQYRSHIEKRLETETLAALGSNPELAVYRLNVSASNQVLQLSGKLPTNYLRDRAFQIASQSAPQWKIDNQIIAVQVPPDPTLTNAEVQRITKIFNQRQGIAISTKYANGKVTVEGDIRDRAEAQNITQALDKIPGIQLINSTVIVSPPQLNTRFYFDLGSSQLKTSDASKIAELKLFLNQYPSYNLKIIGKSDRTGNPSSNYQLSLERAKAVSSKLIQQGIAPQRLSVVGNAAINPDFNSSEPQWMSRRVEFQPTLALTNSVKVPTDHTK